MPGFFLILGSWGPPVQVGCHGSCKDIKYRKHEPQRAHLRCMGAVFSFGKPMAQFWSSTFPNQICWRCLKKTTPSRATFQP